jgi:hypothetical protein
VRSARAILRLQISGAIEQTEHLVRIEIRDGQEVPPAQGRGGGVDRVHAAMLAGVPDGRHWDEGQRFVY